jgi:hypothetical protein
VKRQVEPSIWVFTVIFGSWAKQERLMGRQLGIWAKAAVERTRLRVARAAEKNFMVMTPGKWGR